MFQNGLSLSDISAVTRGNNDGFGDNGWWVIIILLALFGGWGNGRGFGGYGNSGASDNYVLSSDFATIQRQLSDGFNSIDNALDRQNAGICDLGYTQQSLINGLGMNMMQGFNATQTQLADCCCKTQQNIKDTQYAVATTGAGIQNQIQSCCCDVERQIERGFADTNYNMATQNCATLQAIDKVGDRIIDYMNANEKQNLRDENFALKLASSQAQQNNFIQNLVKPQINPCYLTQNPYCSCGNALNYGFGYGTTIA